MPSRRTLLASAGVAATALAGCASLTRDSDPPLDCGPANLEWPTYGVDAARTSHGSARELPPDDATTRRFSETGGSPGGGGSAEAPPVVDDGVVYTAGGVQTEARALDTGERLWAVDPGDNVNTSPSLGCGAVVVSTLNETVAYDRADGTERWRADVGATGFEGPSSPTAHDDTVYVPGGPLVALDAETGDVRWQTDGIRAGGVAVADRVYVTDGGNGTVAAVTDSGELWWSESGFGAIRGAPAVADGRVYVATDAARALAFDTETGDIEWEARLDGQVGHTPAVVGNTVVYGAGDGDDAVAFDATTGERRWSFTTGISQSGPVAAGDRVFVSGANTGFWALDLTTGTEEWYSGELGDVGSSPVVLDGAILYRSWAYSDVAILA